MHLETEPFLQQNADTLQLGIRQLTPVGTLELAQESNYPSHRSYNVLMDESGYLVRVVDIQPELPHSQLAEGLHRLSIPTYSPRRFGSDSEEQIIHMASAQGLQRKSLGGVEMMTLPEPIPPRFASEPDQLRMSMPSRGMHVLTLPGYAPPRFASEPEHRMSMTSQGMRVITLPEHVPPRFASEPEQHRIRMASSHPPPLLKSHMQKP